MTEETENTENVETEVVEAEAPAAEAEAAPVAEEASEAPAEAAEEPVAEEKPGADADEESSSSSSSSSEEGSGEEEAASKGPDPEVVKALVAKPKKDARYYATGKRKTSVARVILTPGKGTSWINGREINEYFPRYALQSVVNEPMELVGATGHYHIRARIHGGGVSSQAGALKHGIARALATIDPAVRTQLKSRGYLKLDARQVERKKAGLKKARKRPQFSKR